MGNLEQENKEALHKEDNPQSNPQEYTAEQRERHLQQIEGSRKEADRKESMIIETYKELASQDASYLDKLAEKDPKLADKVAKEFEYDSYEDLKSSLETDKSSNNSFSEKDFDKMYKERREKELDTEARETAQSIIQKVPEELREKAQSYFDVISEGRKLTHKKATEFAEMATLYASKDKIGSDKSEEFYSAMASTGIQVSKPSKKQEEWFVIDRNKRQLIPLESK